MQTAHPKLKKKIRPYAFGIYFWPFTALALAGLVDSAYLAVSHYRVYTDIGYESFCAISRAINCDTVSQSPYAIIWGMPVPVWGVIGYIFVLLLIVLAGMPSACKKRTWAILILISALFSVYSIVLAVISHFYIHSYCIMCILIYGINFIMLFYAWLIRRRFDSGHYGSSLIADVIFLWHQRRKTAAAMVPFLAGVILLWSFFPTYWKVQTPEITAEVETGLTPEGYPWIGSKNADIKVTLFTDYLCFQCNKVHHYLRKMINRYPGKLRLIHRHFPMDSRVNPIVKTPFHEGSGMLSLLAIYAVSENKFWQTNDYLYANARASDEVDLRKVAGSLTLNFNGFFKSLKSPAARQRLNQDIIDGLRLGVTGTPSFLIDGKLYISQVPADILSKIIH